MEQCTYSSTYDTLIGWPLYAWKSQDISDYIQANDIPLNPLYEQGYGRVGCWVCMQDMFYKDSRLFTLQQQHPKLYATMRKKFGGQMIRLLSAWAELDEFEFKEEHLRASTPSAPLNCSTGIARPSAAATQTPNPPSNPCTAL